MINTTNLLNKHLRKVVFFSTTLSVVSILSSVVSAQDRAIYEEASNAVKTPNAASKLGANLFGDSVNLYNGGLDFVHTDFELKGNSNLRVGVSRRFISGGFKPLGRYFGAWDLEIPKMHGVFAASMGWQTDSMTSSRCSQFGPPPPAAGIQTSGYFETIEYWQGTSLYIPGIGDQLVLQRDPNNTLKPTNQAGAIQSNAVTKDFWTFTCTSALANPSSGTNPRTGEGFIALSPDGTKYQFDHMVQISTNTVTKSTASGGAQSAALTTNDSDQKDTSKKSSQDTKKIGGGVSVQSVITGTASLPRHEIWLLPTKITDRHGNFVQYNYDPSTPGKLTSIVASDGRQVTFSYGVAGQPLRITSVTDGTRTWTYQYDLAGTDLQKVILPDATSWEFNLNPLSQFLRAGSGCGLQTNFDPSDKVGTIKHPSGATGTFTMAGLAHGRSNVATDCIFRYGAYSQTVPLYLYTRSVKSKTISGPGLANLTWTYDYGVPVASTQQGCADSSCVKTKTVIVTDPVGVKNRYIFGNEYRVSEGQLQRTDIGWNGSTALQTTETFFLSSKVGHPFPDIAGNTGAENFGDSEQNARYRPMNRKVITQQGQTFTWEATNFDEFARPTKVTKTGPSGSRNETTAYFNNKDKWVLGQIDSVTNDNTGLVMQKNDYDANAMLWKRHQFGLLQETLTYDTTTGVLATKKDGLNQTTIFSDYKLGIPRLVTYANSTTEGAVVNNIGLVTSHTNAAGHTTAIEYDAMGRLKKVTPPEGNPTVVDFVFVNALEKDLAAGHWRQTVSKGNSRSVTYFDALLRPALTSTFDTASQATTEKSVLSRFDHNGNVLFQSYPQRNISGINASVTGVTSVYDALGRTTQSTAASELGNLITTMSYLSGFTKRVTNPLNQSTTTAFHTFDEPSESAPVTISAPEGVTVQINRDILGKTTSITRSGTDGATATRSYVYDANQRLCKTIEPEVKATIQSYDAASNVTWRATGVNALSTSSCDHNVGIVSLSRVNFGYDSLNRLLTSTYADGSPTISRTYTADGLPFTVSTNGPGTPTWTSSYNARRLLTNESLSFEGQTYNVGRVYDANGNVTHLNYPSQSGIASVDFLPNALGEATKIGSYASGIQYYPNGAVSGFTYGNGIVHSMVQNARGIPQQSRDVGILNDTYIYDKNANVMSITDAQENINTRSMTYDNLDRLKTATGFFGNASYTYDSIDNLKTSTIGSRSNIHTYNASTNLLSNISSSDSNFNFTYSYDSQGNITQRGAQAYVFDAGNRLTSATGKATYSYDGFGHRVKTTNADGSTQISVYTPAGQILFTQKTGGTNPGKTTYIYLNRHQIAEVKN